MWHSPSIYSVNGMLYRISWLVAWHLFVLSPRCLVVKSTVNMYNAPAKALKSTIAIQRVDIQNGYVAGDVVGTNQFFVQRRFGKNVHVDFNYKF